MPEPFGGFGNALAGGPEIFGNIDANTIDGGGGVDRLTGDAGNDTFVFHAGQANGDTVVDFVGRSSANGGSKRRLRQPVISCFAGCGIERKDSLAFNAAESPAPFHQAIELARKWHNSRPHHFRSVAGSDG
jgi:transposase InsO family protein